MTVLTRSQSRNLYNHSKSTIGIKKDNKEEECNLEIITYWREEQIEEAIEVVEIISPTQNMRLNIELEVNIDFDESSKEWRKNKRCIGNGQFKYIKIKR